MRRVGRVGISEGDMGENGGLPAGGVPMSRYWGGKKGNRLAPRMHLWERAGGSGTD